MPIESPNINVMVKAAEKAARSLVRDFGEVEKLQVSKKGPADFVSLADIRSEEIIREELGKARPDYSFLGEEGGETKGSDTSHRWIIDPLDGTSNFLHGIPHWNISIALEEEGEVVAGIIYDPIKDELFRAEKGAGAFMNRSRLRVSSRRDLGDSIIGMGSPSHGRTEEERALWIKEVTALHSHVSGSRRLGACALDLAYVAAGRFEGTWERGVKAWDMAAGIVLVREAGGTVTDMNYGQNMFADNCVLGGNAHIHPQLAKILGVKRKK